MYHTILKIKTSLQSVAYIFPYSFDIQGLFYIFSIIDLSHHIFRLSLYPSALSNDSSRFLLSRDFGVLSQIGISTWFFPFCIWFHIIRHSRPTPQDIKLNGEGVSIIISQDVAQRSKSSNLMWWCGQVLAKFSEIVALESFPYLTAFVW